jgi:uncharacterized protein YchJ
LNELTRFIDYFKSLEDDSGEEFIFSGENEALSEEEMGTAPPKKTPSRNAPCPCGSGKRFKHCHGAEI